MADADKPQPPKPPPSTTKKKTKAQTAAMKEQMAKMQKQLQDQEKIQENAGALWDKGLIKQQQDRIWLPVESLQEQQQVLKDREN